MVLLIVVLLAFGASVTHGFHLDDYAVVHGPDWNQWQTRPLTGLSFAVNSKLSENPPLWHLVSLTGHVAAVLLLYQVLLFLLPEQTALLAAAIFAVHPLQAETVAYVFSRATIFSTLFSLGAFLAWRRDRPWLAVASLALAILSKEDCAAVPLVILAMERPRNRRRVIALTAMFSAVIAAAVHSVLVTRAIAGSGAGYSAGSSPLLYLLNQGFVIIRYLRLLIFPYGFTVDAEIHVTAGAAIVSWIAVIALGVFAARNNRYVLAGLLLLIPSSSIVPLADLSADHRMYLPMIAFAPGLALWLGRLPKWTGVVVVLVLVGISAERMGVWGNEERLWTEAVERAPDKLRPRIQLARAVGPKRALAILQDTKPSYPNSSEVNGELGRVYLELGHPELALAEFGTVLGRNPRDPHAMNNRGVALRALGQEAAARQDFERALKLDSCLEDARRNLNLPPCA